MNNSNGNSEITRNSASTSQTFDTIESTTLQSITSVPTHTEIFAANDKHTRLSTTNNSKPTNQNTQTCNSSSNVGTSARKKFQISKTTTKLATSSNTARNQHVDTCSFPDSNISLITKHVGEIRTNPTAANFTAPNFVSDTDSIISLSYGDELENQASNELNYSPNRNSETSIISADTSNNATELQSNQNNRNSRSSASQHSRLNLADFLVNSPHPSRSSTVPTAYQNTIYTNKTYRCYRALIGNGNEMTIATTPLPANLPQAPPSFEEAVNDSTVNILPSPVPPQVQHGPPPLAGAPPSYSAVMRIGPVEQPWPYRDRAPIRIQPSPPFIAPIPPPTYSQAQGHQIERPLIIASADHLAWGPNPISVICPRCAHVVITSTQSHRSNLTHFSALALFLCGCWPCCLLPYCMDTCKNTYHSCPNCQQLLGIYRPW